MDKPKTLEQILDDKGPYYFDLVKKNHGSTVVNGWGHLSYDGGYKVGLEQKEAMELIGFDGMLIGISIGKEDHDYAYDLFYQRYDQWEASLNLEKSDA